MVGHQHYILARAEVWEESSVLDHISHPAAYLEQVVI